MKISIIVPCYNESENVEKLHDELLPVIEELVTHGWKNSLEEKHTAEVIFVDDGSGDGTFDKLTARFGNEQRQRITFRFVKHEVNKGLGAAVRTGFSNASGDILVTVDSDGTYKFSEIPNVLSYLTPGVAIVTASPYHPQGGVVGVPAYRLLLSRGSSLLYRLLLDWNVHTYTALFRAYRAEVVKNISFESNGFLAGTELMVKAMLSGYKVVEFPALLHKRMFGVSKAKIMQTILAHLKFQGWIFVQRLQMLFGLKEKRTRQIAENTTSQFSPIQGPKQI